MTGRENKLYHFIFIATLVCLTIFKWNDFALPYFWDELGVYTRAADYQVQHSISLEPASAPPVLSRGHPLLFTSMNALVWRVFGEEVRVAHLFCFFIALVLLVAVYLKISKYFNERTGLACALICLMQPLFVAQSALVLPEVTLALFIFMALCSYYEGRVLWFAFYASLAMLTKESAIVLPVVVIVYSILQWAVVKEKPQALKLTGLVLIALPYLTFGCFLLLQKKQNGWYFFPYHMDAVVFDISVFVQQAAHFLLFVFVQQGRYVLTVLTAMGLVFSLALNKQAITRRSGFLFLLVLFGVAFLGFNSLFGVYMGRYATIVVVVFCIAAGVAITSVSESNLYMALVMAGLLVVSYRHLEQPQFNYDEDMGYRRQVHVLQQGVTEMIRIMKPGDKPGSNFPGFFALGFDKGGYLNGAKINPDRLTDKDYDYYLLCNPPDAGFDVDSSKYITLVKAFDDGYAHTSLYRVRRK